MGGSTAHKKYYFFIGTVAELIKFLPAIKKFKEEGADFKIISSGQNNISNSELLRSLGIQKPDITLYNKHISQNPLSLTIWFMEVLISSIFNMRKQFAGIDKQNTFMVVHGDTVSTLLGTILAKTYGLKVAHIEAGLRSFNLLQPFPEEICRVLVSKMVDVHFCPNRWALDNLKNQNSIKVDTGCNTLMESMEFALRQDSETPVLNSSAKYFIFVVHRQENLYDVSLIGFLIDKLLEISKKMNCVFILHEPTKKVLESLGLLQKIESAPGIQIVPRLPYFKFQKLLKNCEFIITDGGSNQEEAYYMGKPCLVLRSTTERTEGLNYNVVISNNDQLTIENFVENYQNYKKEEQKLESRPSQIIFSTLENYRE